MWLILGDIFQILCYSLVNFVSNYWNIFSDFCVGESDFIRILFDFLSIFFILTNFCAFILYACMNNYSGKIVRNKFLSFKINLFLKIKFSEK